MNEKGKKLPNENELKKQIPPAIDKHKYQMPSTKDELEYEKLHEELRQLKKPILKTKWFWTALATSTVAICGFLVPLLSGTFLSWYDIKKEELLNQRTLVEVETTRLENDKILLEIKNAKLEEEYETKNSKLDKEYNEKSQELQKKSQILKVKFKKDISALTEEYRKLKEEVKSIASFTNWYSRGAGELLDNKPEEAIASFEKALETKPEKLSAAYTHSYIGRAYFRLSNYPASFAAFNDAFESYITLNLDHALQCFNEMLIVFKGMNIDDKKSFKDDIDQLQEQLIEAKNKGTTK